MVSISNIAWDVSLDSQVSELLSAQGVTYIDIAPPKYFKDIYATSDADILKVKNYWLDKGIKILGMQSLLFGTQGLNVFGSQEVQEKLLTHLAHVCHIGNVLGASKLVFGSPRNRDRAHLNDQDTQEVAANFFGRLGDIASSENVIICLEPNPVCYQANFMTTSLETAEVVKNVYHKHIKMQLDIGAMDINNECPEDIIKHVAPYIHHIHISEPQLAPLNMNNPIHKKASSAIKSYFPNMPMTIEMLTSTAPRSLEEIEHSIRIVKTIYQGR